MFIRKNIITQPRFKSGFTLIELLVVIVIIGILATLTTVALTSARAKARDARRISDLRQISSALELYQADYNYYPSAITAGNALTDLNNTKTYMAKVPGDPSTNASYAYGGYSNYTLRAVLEKGTVDLPAGSIVITSKSGVKLPDNTDARLVDDALTFGGALIGHWALDANTTSSGYVNDLSGNGNDGAITGATLAAGIYGEVGGAYSFNGSNNYINLGDPTILQPDYISLSLNFKSTATGTRAMLRKRLNGYRVTLTDGKLYIQIFSTGGLANNFTSIENYNDGLWHNVVVTFSSTHMTVYVDGFLLSTQLVLSNKLFYSADAITIGRDGGVSTNYFSGSISDVRIYSRALVASEVTQLYNAMKP